MTPCSMQKSAVRSGLPSLVLVLLLFIARIADAMPLAGVKTIGGISPDYPTISDAVADLNVNGISAPVTFFIRSGSYDEQVTINSFRRTGNADDLVIFSRDGPAASKPIWQYSGANSAGNNYVVTLDGADYVTFRNIEFNAVGTAPYGRIFYIQNTVDHLTLEGCELTGFISSESEANLIDQDFGSDAENLTVTQSTFTRGRGGLVLKKATAGQPIILDNVFAGQVDVGMDMNSSFASVDGNSFNDATFSDALYFGLSISDLNAVISNNTIDIDDGFRGINVFSSAGNPAALSNTVVENNMVAVGSPTNADVGILIGLSGVTLRHNTVRMERDVAEGLYIASDVTDTVLLNNNLVHGGGGLVMIVDNGQVGVDRTLAIAEANYNNYYSTSGFVTLEWDGATYGSLNDFYYDSGVDRHSTRINVFFANDVTHPLDLHLAAPSNNDASLLAPSLATVDSDIDGDARGMVTTYKGADEGTPIDPLDNADTASGFYTVGGVSPDYATPGQALDDLAFRGMKGPVTFRVRGGTYTFRRSLNAILRTGDSDDRVHLRAANINNQPVFRNGTTNPDENWILQVDDTDFVQLTGIAFESTSAGGLGRLVHLTGDTDDIEINLCTFTGVTGEISDTASLVYGDTAGQERITFSDNTLLDGSYGLYLAPPPFSGITNDATLVNGNIFQDQLKTAFFSDHGDIEFIDNTVESSAVDFVGLYLRNENKSQFQSNRIHLTGANSIGIQFDNYDGVFLPKSLIANNFVSAAIGIDFIGSSAAWHVYHNTIVGSVAPLNYTDSGGSQEIVDNILINSGSGAALVVDEAADIESFEYNRLHNTSGPLIEWEGLGYASLSTFAMATGLGANSTEGAVTFVDQANNDLHLTGGSVGDVSLSGVSVFEVTVDIDNDTRGVVPYVGADESSMLPIPNDFAPVIAPNQMRSVVESASVGAGLGTAQPLSATDPDPGSVLQDWMIVAGNTGDAFAIDSDTGLLTVNNPLDRETTADYILQVTVSDGVNVSETETVTVTLVDVNDTAPVIGAGQMAMVPEDALVDDSVLVVSATDADLATTLQDWTIVGGNPGNAFSINPASGEIQVAGPLDFETTPTYALSVSVSDGTNVSAPETVTIQVQDVDETVPQVTPGQSAMVAEDAGIGSAVLTVAGTGPDNGSTLQDWTIIAGNGGGAFSINSSSGQVTVAAELDFETTTDYGLMITVSDGSIISDPELVLIAVTNVNDNVPVVDADQTAVVDDDAMVGRGVITVTATDADVDTVFQDWTISGGNIGGAFDIEPATGLIFVAGALDFATTPAYTLQVLVSDGLNASDAENVGIVVADASSGVDLSLSIDNQSDELIEGQSIGYDIVAANAGPDDAIDAIITVAPPNELGAVVWTCISADPGATCRAAGTNVLADTITLPAGASVVYVMEGDVNQLPGFSLTMMGSVAPAAGITENNSIDNTAQDSDVVVSDPLFMNGFEGP